MDTEPHGPGLTRCQQHNQEEAAYNDPRKAPTPKDTLEEAAAY